ncbi:MAG: hypothetical protein HY519_02790 [Candidatus Aenigmarchaeota archaeon]|nr:hypothetical protein [Candidatus Aenigmarchaeota archaeon]
MLDHNAKIAVGISALAIFFIVIFTLLHTYVYTPQVATIQESCAADGCPHESQIFFLQELIPLLMGASLIAGAGVYYLMAQKLEAKGMAARQSTEVMVKLLNEDERKVVSVLLENRGKVLQAEVSRLPGMSKVRSHRVIKRLMLRGVLETESVGKTNVVRFRKEIIDALFG